MKTIGIPAVKRIGIPILWRAVEWYLNFSYISYLEKNGYSPVLLTNSNIDGVDGILLPGGIDVDPTQFGYNNSNSYNCNTEMDKVWEKIVSQAIERGIPILGICRGHQFLFYYMEKHYSNDENMPYLMYMQHISDHNQADNKIPRDQLFHSVICRNGQKVFVNSMHHQGILIHKKLWENYFDHIVSIDSVIIPEAIFPNYDKHHHVLEAASYNVGNFRGYSVQWHPEELDNFGHLLTQTFGE